MNRLEKETYFEPNFDINEFVNDDMNEEEKEKIRKQTADFYKGWTDDDFRHLGDNY